MSQVAKMMIQIGPCQNDIVAAVRELNLDKLVQKRLLGC